MPTSPRRRRLAVEPELAVMQVGIRGARGAARRRGAEAGVTLVEILVVLSVIAIAAGAVMLRLGFGTSEDALTGTAQRLALAVTEASDAALASGEDRVLEVGPQGYALRPASGAVEWRGLSGLSLNRADALTGALRLAADGTSAPFALILAQDRRTVTVSFDGLVAQAGEVTP